jgi:hypothetical protein
VHLQQYSGKVSVGHIYLIFLVTTFHPLKKLIDCQLVYCPNLWGAIVDHRKRLMIDVRMGASGLKLVGESVDILDSEGTGGNQGDDGRHVPAGAPSNILLDQR